MVCYTIPYFASIYITFVNSKLFFKASGRPYIMLTVTFAEYQINNISTVTVQKLLNFIFVLGRKASKSGEITKKCLQMSHFLLHSSIEHSFCLVFLGNNDDHKSSLKF